MLEVDVVICYNSRATYFQTKLNSIKPATPR
jgi:hypothetical protein